MLRADVKKIAALEMSQCPNCSHAIDQMGKRTHCQKCGKQLTVLCISCQINNPILFLNCMRCGSDFRVVGVEYYAKQAAKLEFDLKEFDRLDQLYKQAVFLEKSWKLIFPIISFLFGTPMWYFSKNIWGLLLPFDLAFIAYLLIKIYGQQWATHYVGMPLEFAKRWKPISQAAKRQAIKKEEIDKQLDYYTNELNRFRQKTVN